MRFVRSAICTSGLPVSPARVANWAIISCFSGEGMVTAAATTFFGTLIVFLAVFGAAFFFPFISFLPVFVAFLAILAISAVVKKEQFFAPDLRIIHHFPGLYKARVKGDYCLLKRG